MDYDDLQSGQRPSEKKGFPALLEKMQPEIAKALPRHLNADRMARIALTEFRKNPAIGDCDVSSILGSIITLAQLGLEPGVMGQAFLVPYWDRQKNVRICQAIPGWQGLADLVSRSGRATVWTNAAYKGDEFDYAYGDRPFVNHKPGDEVDVTDDDLLYVYAVGRIRDSDWPIIEVWSRAKITKHRDKYNKVGDRHYSYNNFEMYARKIVLLQVIKYLPKSVELQRAVDLEHAAQTGMAIDMNKAIDGTWMAPPLDDTPPASAPKTSGASGPGPVVDKPADDIVEDHDKTPVVKKKTGGKKKSPAKKKAAAKKADPEEQADNDEDQQESAGDGPQMSFNDIFRSASQAKSVEKLDELLDAARGLPEKQRESLSKIISQARESLEEEGQSEREPGSDDDIGDLE